MKTNNNFLKSIVYLALVLFAFSCEKPPEPEPVSQEPVMPPLTHTGANTFGCYIDGELFVANEGPSVWSIPPVSGSFDEETRELKVQGTKYDGESREYIYLFSNIDDSAGEYQFETYGGEALGYSGLYNDLCDYYYLDRPDLGRLNILYLNEETNIISGTFNIILSNTNCVESASMQIIDGRFDFRY